MRAIEAPLRTSGFFGSCFTRCGMRIGTMAAGEDVFALQPTRESVFNFECTQDDGVQFVDVAVEPGGDNRPLQSTGDAERPRFGRAIKWNICLTGPRLRDL